VRDPNIVKQIYPDYGSRLNWLFHRILFFILPRQTLAPLRDELHLLRVRLQSLVQRPPDAANQKHLLVNIGAGPLGRDGWINIDGWMNPGITFVHDCRHGIPLANNAARAIYAEHFLEHIDYIEDVPVFLHECLRILEPGGVLRIIVPDAEKYLDAYATPGWDKMRLLQKEPSFTKMEIVNEIFRGGGCGILHRYAYDFETIDKVLTKAGFREIRKLSFGLSALPELAIDHPNRAHESLYVEAMK
jgi:predicted SAM-dependent methyltransferase